MNEAAPRPRLPGVDVLRGVAVAAMVVYHFTWDLRYFGLISTDVVNHPFWMNFARAIAGAFLLLSGVSLALLARGGLDRDRFLRRLAIITGAALLVTVATYFAMPNAYIFFGILHCIALSSVLALPFLRLPAALTIAAAAAVLALPLVVSHSLFDSPMLQWIGLGTRAPVTNDYVPAFPWFGLVLAGVAMGRMFASAPPAALVGPPTGAFDKIARVGRLSLPIYLVHQPILMALIGAAALALPPSGPDRVTLDFRQSCREACLKAGGAEAMCPRYCACAEDELKKEQLWTPLLRNGLTARQQTQVTAITMQCEAKARQP